MSDFGETFSPIARNNYRCEWCYWTIPKGEKHKHFSGTFDGEWQDWRMHDECYEAQQDEARRGEPEFTPGCADPPARIKNLLAVASQKEKATE